MIRLAIFLALACLVFGVGGVLGAGDRLLNKAGDARATVEGARQLAGCKRPEKVVSISFSKTKYPNIRKHYLRAAREGWPKVFTLNREGADQRRDKALEGIPTTPGHDRDEVPPAVGRESWRAHVAPVPSSENRSHGSVMGIKLRPYCDGTRFRYAFY